MGQQNCEITRGEIMSGERWGRTWKERNYFFF